MTNVNALFHCFGNNSDALVDTDTALKMLRSSNTNHLPINTHNINDVNNWKELPVGHHTAQVGEILDKNEFSNLIPVLNINFPNTVEEAYERTKKAVELTGFKIIKLEVLSEDLKTSDPNKVLEVVKLLNEDYSDLEIWPLITPDIEIFKELENEGCPLIRIMGSPIASMRGIASEWESDIKEIVNIAKVPLMLDGGVGSVEDATKAIKLGFDSVLVNSCLFAEKKIDPANRLDEFYNQLNSISEASPK